MRFSKSPFAIALLALAPFVSAASAQTTTANSIKIGFQRSSTLIATLKANGGLEEALKPLKVSVTWSEFTSGLPLLEALNLGNIDFSADVADTVPVFAQAAGARLAYVAEEAPSPSAQAILVPEGSPIRSVADLKGKKVAVTKAAGSHYLLIAALASAGLTFKDIRPVYLAPGDGKAAFVSNNVDAWVAWDPFLTSTQRDSKARVLLDGKNIANYKRYYLASEDFAKKQDAILNVIYRKLDETGKWVKSQPKEASALLAGIWGIDAATIEEANSHRSYKVGAVTLDGLQEQQKIADTFQAEGLIPKKVDTKDVLIWKPKAQGS
jgi:sulfonate transport system substrate-binding protein